MSVERMSINEKLRYLSAKVGGLVVGENALTNPAHEAPKGLANRKAFLGDLRKLGNPGSRLAALKMRQGKR